MVENKIDSNITGLAFAEELTLKTLPPAPRWYALEPNSYSDFGGEIATVARAPIDPSRQRKKGTVTDLDASGGFNIDMTQNNLLRLLQGFFFANVREKPTTKSMLTGDLALTAVTASAFESSGGMSAFLEGHLILATGMGTNSNNGLHVVDAGGTSTSVPVTDVLLSETSPPSSAAIEVCGFQFPLSDVDVTVQTSTFILNSASVVFSNLGLNVGEWIWIGGDAAGNQFALNGPGWARIKEISGQNLILETPTFTPAEETGTGLEVQIFFGNVLRNEDQLANIVRRSYNIERQLGNDGSGIQSEYLTGSVANEFTLNVPSTDKVTADLTFVAMDNEQRTGAQGIKSGTRYPALNEEAFNTSSDVYRMKLNIVDPSTMSPTALYAFVSEATLTINNGVTANKAIGVLGSFDATAGDFQVGGSLTAYFSDVAAVAAVRNNEDVAFNLIAAQRNAGVVFDIPLLALSGGRLNVEKDAPIMIPLEQMAAENPYGYTLMFCFLPYLPDVAMP